MADKEDEVLALGYLLQKNLENYKVNLPGLSTLAQKGNDELVDKFLTENVTITGGTSEQKQSQLYIASFWGFYDVVKSLVEGGAEINVQNSGTLWTPLHAAAFQEHGKIVMYLLEKGVDPHIKDSEGRSPADFASASDKVWAHFAASGCTRTSKQELVKKLIIRKVSDPATSNTRPHSSSTLRLSSVSRPDSAYAIQSSPFRRAQKSEDATETPQNDGDVLANERSPRPEDRPDSGKRATSALIPPWNR